MKKDFNISQDIYSSESIAEAIEDFWEVAEMTYDLWKLSISGWSEDEIQEVFHEFMNYVLSI